MTLRETYLYLKQKTKIFFNVFHFRKGNSYHLNKSPNTLPHTRRFVNYLDGENASVEGTPLHVNKANKRRVRSVLYFDKFQNASLVASTFRSHNCRFQVTESFGLRRSEASHTNFARSFFSK